MKNYYKLLGVHKNASTEQINSAFKKLSLKYHPDRNGGNLHYSELFKEINEAKQVLSDHEKRGDYDIALKNRSGLSLLFSNRRRRRQARIQRRRKETPGDSKLASLKWLATILGLAILIMFILIAIDNAINFFSEDEQPVFLKNIINENRMGVLSVIESQFVRSVFNA
jgi:curved DNA-binding protein CbpA